MKPDLRIFLAVVIFQYSIESIAQSVAEVTTTSDLIVLTVPYFEIDTDEGRKAYSVELTSPIASDTPVFEVNFNSLVELEGVEANAPAGCDEPTESPLEISRANFFIEHNATDADTGVHGNFDDEGWTRLCVWDPNDNLILNTDPSGQLGDLGISGIFFESNEPPNDELTISELKTMFPEGQYLVRGKNIDGSTMQGEATFTHDIPNPATITNPIVVEDDEDAGDAILSPTNFVVTWEPVLETIDGDLVNVTSYQVIITKDEHEDPNGASRPVYDVHVPGNVTSLSVPEEFFESGTLYELEVLVIEQSGNQTIGLGFFQTE